LLETVLDTQRLNLVKNWVKPLTKRVRGFRGAGLKFYEFPDENVNVKDLGVLVRLETEPGNCFLSHL